MDTESINILILVIFSILYLGLIWVFGLYRLFPSPKTSFLRKKPQKRIPFFDFAKGMAILAIIIIHVSFLMGAFQDKFSVSFFEWSEHINRLMRFAIPVFLLSSGALLTLKGFKRETLKKFYFSKIQRIGIPYIIFSSFASYLYSPEIKNFFQYLIVALRDILTGQALVPFWFLPVLFQLYIFYPLLWYLFLVKKIKPWLLLLFSLLFSLGCYFIAEIHAGWRLIFGDWFFGPFLFFFVLGMVLSSLLLSENREWLRKIHLPFWTLLVVVLYLGISMTRPLETYYNARFVYGPTMFLFLFYFYPQLSRFRISKFIAKIGENSLYFYLIHFFVLSFLTKLIVFFDLFYINPFLLFAGLFLFGFSITHLLSFLVKKLYNSFWRALAISNK